MKGNVTIQIFFMHNKAKGLRVIERNCWCIWSPLSDSLIQTSLWIWRNNKVLHFEQKSPSSLNETAFHVFILSFCRDPLDQPDLLAKMELMDSPAPLDLLDLVDALENLVLLYVTCHENNNLQPNESVCYSISVRSHFVLLPSSRVLLVIPDHLVLPGHLALASTCLLLLAWVRWRRAPILSGTWGPMRHPALWGSMTLRSIQH